MVILRVIENNWKRTNVIMISDHVKHRETIKSDEKWNLFSVIPHVTTCDYIKQPCKVLQGATSMAYWMVIVLEPQIWVNGADEVLENREKKIRSHYASFDDLWAKTLKSPNAVPALHAPGCTRIRAIDVDVGSFHLKKMVRCVYYDSMIHEWCQLSTLWLSLTVYVGCHVSLFGSMSERVALERGNSK